MMFCWAPTELASAPPEVMLAESDMGVVLQGRTGERERESERERAMTFKQHSAARTSSASCNCQEGKGGYGIANMPGPSPAIC